MPSALNAAEMMYATGKSANATAISPTRWRHQFPQTASARRRRRSAARAPAAVRRVGVLERAHRMFSRAFVRQNETPEIVATMKKMTIETALASP